MKILHNNNINYIENLGHKRLITSFSTNKVVSNIENTYKNIIS